jgi:hypothetical protein
MGNGLAHAALSWVPRKGTLPGDRTPLAAKQKALIRASVAGWSDVLVVETPRSQGSCRHSETLACPPLTVLSSDGYPRAWLALYAPDCRSLMCLAVKSPSAFE